MRLLIQAFIFSLFVFNSSGQILNFNKELFKDLNKDTTFIIIKDPEAPEAQPYKEVFIKYLTFANIQFIDYSQIKKIKRQGNSYIALKCIEDKAWDTRCSDVGEERDETYNLDLEFVRYVRKFTYANDVTKKTMATLDLEPDRSYGSGLKVVIMGNNIDGGGYLKYWSPGVLAMGLRELNLLLNSTQTADQKKEFNRKKLLQLANDTLFIIGKVSEVFTGNKKNKYTIEDVYPYPFKEITIEEYYEKLSHDEADFLFFLLRYNNICDAHTGTIIFSKAFLGYPIPALREIAGKIKLESKK